MNFTQIKKSVYFSAAIIITSILFTACSNDDKKAIDESATAAATSEFKEGIHYKNLAGFTLSTEQKTATLNTPKITEFFWYGCPHCQSFAPLLSDWSKNHSTVEVQYIPVIWNEVTETHAKIFFLIRDKDNFSELHKAMFEIVAGLSRTADAEQHKASIINQLNALGVPASETRNAINNDTYAKAMAAVLLDMKNYQVAGVPTLIVNNQYKVLNAKLTSMPQALSVAESLLKK